MTMRAILLTPKNFDKIESDHDPNPPRAHLRRLYLSYQVIDTSAYFIPMFETITGVDTRDWCVIDEEYLKESFSYDKELIKTQFVEIIRG